MRTKYTAYIPGTDPDGAIEINGLNEPKVKFEELEVLLADGTIAHLAGNYSWNRIKTRTNCSKLYGQEFEMHSDDWIIDGCYILADKTIYFKNARLRDYQDNLDGI